MLPKSEVDFTFRKHLQNLRKKGAKSDRQLIRKSSEHNKSTLRYLNIWISPGNSTKKDIKELFGAFSETHRAAGGSGLRLIDIKDKIENRKLFTIKKVAKAAPVPPEFQRRQDKATINLFSRLSSWVIGYTTEELERLKEAGKRIVQTEAYGHFCH